MTESGMTVVTGASGHVGGNLVRALLDKGRDVRVLVRNDTRALDGLTVDRVAGDVLDPASLSRAFAGATTVFHLAARISIAPGDEKVVEATNMEGVRNVAEACIGAGVKRLVHFSSIHAFRLPPQDEKMDETKECVDPDKAMVYDRTKAAGEGIVREAVGRGLDAVIVNPTAVLGPFDFKPSPMGDVILALMRGSLPALVDGGYDWVDVRDVCAGAIAAAEKGRKGEKYLLSGTYVPFKDVGRMVGEAAGVKVPKMVSPLWLAAFGAPFALRWALWRGKRPLFTPGSIKILKDCNKRICNDKARSKLGYSTRPIEETISDACGWFRESGMV